MNLLKLESMITEFPALKEILAGKPSSQINSITVKRVTEDTLVRIPTVYYQKTDTREMSCHEIFHGVAQDRHVILNIAANGVSPLEGLVVHNIPDLSQLILTVSLYHKVNGVILDDKLDVFVFKCPDNTIIDTLAKYHQLYSAQAKTEVSA